METIKYLKTETRGGITRRVYETTDYMEGQRLAVLFCGHCYVFLPADITPAIYHVII